jgi:hypothetical protein
VTSVRRLSVSIIAGLLILGGSLLPGSAAAHSGRAIVAAPPSGALLPALTVASKGVCAQPPAVEIPWLLVGLAGVLLLGALRPQPRRALVVALILLLGVLAVEHGVHSVHHFGEHAAAVCVVAASANHLTVALDDGAPALPAPVTVSRSPVERPASHPLGPSLGPDPARAPPALIA